MSQGIDNPTENWTRFPNCILDNLDRYKPNELKILAFMIRKTLGFRDKANRMFAAEYVAKRLDMSEKTARTAIDGLEESGTVKNIGRSGRMGIKLYEIVWKRPVKITDRQKLERPVKITGDARQKLPTVLDNQHKENHSNADALPLTPPVFEQEKKNKTKKKQDIYPELKNIIEVLKSYEITKLSDNTKRLMRNALEEHGEAFCVEAIHGRFLQMRAKGHSDAFLPTIFDPDRVEWLEQCAKLWRDHSKKVLPITGQSGQMFAKSNTMTADEVAMFEKMLP